MRAVVRVPQLEGRRRWMRGGTTLMADAVPGDAKHTRGWTEANASPHRVLIQTDARIFKTGTGGGTR
jgi:hypothetical protein